MMSRRRLCSHCCWILKNQIYFLRFDFEIKEILPALKGVEAVLLTKKLKDAIIETIIIKNETIII